jgi:purine-binding chemotaxis protein CheW
MAADGKRMAVGEMLTSGPRELCLLVRVSRQLCAIPLAHVEEAMRAQPLRGLPGAPESVPGLAVVRGVALPVVHAGIVLGQKRTSLDIPRRFVTLRTGRRKVVLAVDEVLGVRDMASARWAELPPLLNRAGSEVAGVMALDDELLLVLAASRLVPDDVWASLDPEGAA